jgi:hypothetical protein
LRIDAEASNYDATGVDRILLLCIEVHLRHCGVKSWYSSSAPPARTPLPLAQTDGKDEESTTSQQTWPRLSFGRDDLPCTGMRGWRRVIAEGQNLRWRWYVVSYKWQTAFRSFLGHRSLLSPKGMPVLVLGKSTSVPIQPHTVAQIRARNDGIDTLSAMYPWADLVDKQIFLMGFRAGLEQVQSTPDSQTSKQTTT